MKRSLIKAGRRAVTVLVAPVVFCVIAFLTIESWFGLIPSCADKFSGLRRAWKNA